MKNAIRKMDKPLFFATLLLIVIGLVMVFSSSSVVAVLQYRVSTYYFFRKQLFVVLIGLAFGLFFLLNFPIKNYHPFKSIFMLGIIAALAGLFFYGTVTNSAQSWYRIGPVSLQPSEFAKTVVIIYMACYFGKNINNERRFFFLRPIIACGIVAGMIFLQPDLGTAAIIGLLVFAMFMAVPFAKGDRDVRIFKILGTAAIGLVVIVMFFGGELLNSEQASRLTYRAPCERYQMKTGYQVCNGMIAINNGGLFGVGLGNSTQKYMYLPEAHTDFIFPIIVEELGSIFASFVILLYAFILYRLLCIARRAKDLTSSLISYGTAVLILLHVLINLGGILALIPLTGVPLPLLSYGGSITLNTIILIFISLRVSIENNTKRDAN